MYKLFINIILFLLLSIIIAKLFRKFLEIILPKKQNITILENKSFNFFNLIVFVFLFIFFSYYIFYICIILIFLLLILILMNNHSYIHINNDNKNFLNKILLKVSDYFNGSGDIYNENENYILNKYDLGNGYSLITIDKKLIIYGYFKCILCIFNKEINIYGKVKLKSCIFENEVRLNIFDLKISKTTFKENVTIIIDFKDFLIDYIELNNVIFEKNLIIQGIDFFELNKSCNIKGKIIYKE